MNESVVYFSANALNIAFTAIHTCGWLYATIVHIVCIKPVEVTVTP